MKGSKRLLVQETMEVLEILQGLVLHNLEVLAIVVGMVLIILEDIAIADLVLIVLVGLGTVVQLYLVTLCLILANLEVLVPAAQLDLVMQDLILKIQKILKDMVLKVLEDLAMKDLVFMDLQILEDLNICLLGHLTICGLVPIILEDLVIWEDLVVAFPMTIGTIDMPQLPIKGMDIINNGLEVLEWELWVEDLTLEVKRLVEDIILRAM